MTASSPTRFLIADDHEAILGGTLQALSARYPDAVLETANTAPGRAISTSG